MRHVSLSTVLLPAFAAALLVVLVVVQAANGQRPLEVQRPQQSAFRQYVASLDEARELAPFAIREPAHVPEGFEFAGALHRPVASAIGDAGAGVPTPAPSGDIVSLYYRNPTSGATVELMETTWKLSVAGPTAQAEVNGVTGQIIRGEEFPDHPKPGYVSVQWTSGGISYSAITTLTGDWTLDEFLRMLDSLP